MILKLLERQKFLKGVLLITKKLLFIKGLNIPFHGGLWSYALILMISAYMNSWEYYDWANYLYNFLEFYGTKFC